MGDHTIPDKQEFQQATWNSWQSTHTRTYEAFPPFFSSISVSFEVRFSLLHMHVYNRAHSRYTGVFKTDKWCVLRSG